MKCQNEAGALVSPYGISRNSKCQNGSGRLSSIPPVLLLRAGLRLSVDALRGTTSLFILSLTSLESAGEDDSS